MFWLELFLNFQTISAAELNHQWHFIDNKHYQIVSSYQEEYSDMSNGICSPNMIHVKGNMKLDPSHNNSIEELQKTTCTKWINRNYPERCQTFDRNHWLDISKNFQTAPMNFCIDKYESGNRKGEYPVIYITFPEAQNMCAKRGARLCSEEEWTFACEGEEAVPYGYGYERKKDECGLDRVYRTYSKTAYRFRDKLVPELDRLWQGHPSGSAESCDSAFGVSDMNSNVDEWTTKVRKIGKYNSILKGGAWTGVRNRCRPSTRSHDENFAFYQQSFRCCSSAVEK